MKSDAAINQIFVMLKGLDGEQPCMPPTYLFNEGWMLRLILKAAETASLGDDIERIVHPSKWKSEARLYTPFDETRGIAWEGFTNADGVVGDFECSLGTKAGVRLSEAPKRFEVYEAKMYSPLSKGVKAARWYDQAARNVACMAQTLALSNTKPSDLKQISFSVIAPEEQHRFFSNELSPASIRTKVQMRIDQFEGQGREELVLWYEKYFQPLLVRLENEKMIRRISWQTLIDTVSDKSFRDSITEFYEQCKAESAAAQQKITSNGPSKGCRYWIRGRDDATVVFVCCCPGKKTSRVYREHGNQESFTVDNSMLELVSADPLELPIPNIGDKPYHNERQVRVISIGPCRSTVEYIDSTGRTLLVDNHLLKRALCDDRV